MVSLKNIRLPIIIVLLTLLVALLVPSIAYAQDPINEIVGERTINSKTYDLGNGLRAVDNYIAPIHYREGGQWKDIDTTIVNGRVTKAPYDLTIDYENVSISVRVKADGSVFTLGLDKKFTNITPSINGNRVTWKDIDTDTDLVIIAGQTGVRFQRVLKSDKAPLGCAFDISEPIYSTYEIKTSASDANGNNIDVIESKSANRLTESINPLGLTYPITIDPTIDPTTASNYDDAHESGTNVFTVLNDNLNLYSNLDGGAAAYKCMGLRFQVNVPKDSLYTTAYARLYINDVAFDDMRSDIYAHDTDNAADFNVVGGIDAIISEGERPRTTATTSWSEDGVGAGWGNSPEIKAVVKEITDRAGWVANQHIVLLFIAKVEAAKYYIPRAYDFGDHSLAPILHIEYIAGAPTVTTDAATNIEATTATLNGTVTDDGGETVDYTGFVWDTVADAGDPGDVDPSDPPAGWEFGWKSNVGDYGENPFNHAISGLPTGTTIYFRACAHSVNGWGYGAGGSFLTKPAAPTVVSATDGAHTDKVVITWVKSFGATDYQVYRDGGALGWLGDVATHDDNGADAGSVTAGVASASDGAFEAHVRLELAGEGINDGTSHTYKVRARNATGESADSATDTGFRRPINLTYQWYRSAADADAGYGLLGGATTDPFNDVTAPADGSGRWYYCEVNATGAVAQDSTHDRGFRGAPPQIQSVLVEGRGHDWAILRGYVTDDLGADVTTIGFDYGLTGAYGLEVTTTGAWNTGDYFVLQVDGLTSGTVYHWRAKGTTAGTGYGADAYFATEGSPALREYYVAAGTGDSNDIYGINWTAMQFTSDAMGHTVSSIRLPLKRVLNPGTITVSLRFANTSHEPTGLDIASGTYDGDTLLVGYSLVEIEIDEVALEGDTEYAIVLRVPAGDNANDVIWEAVVAGGYADGRALHSVTSGLTWVDDDPADLRFELWGNDVVEVNGGGVFTGYIEDDDMLFCADMYNIYSPYYPVSDAATYFDLRLYDTDGTTLIASTPVVDWQRRAGSIYLSADSAAGITWGDAYYLKIIGSFDPTNVIASYQLQPEDWYSGSLDYLDKWVIRLAHIMEVHYDMTFVASVSGEERLNDAGGVSMDTGINGLSYVRPDLFQTIKHLPTYTAPTWTGAYDAATDWEAQVGAGVVVTMDTLGDLIGMDGKGIVQILLVCAMLGVALITHSFFFGLLLAMPIAWLGMFLRVMPAAVMMLLGAVATLVIVYKMYFNKG